MGRLYIYNQRKINIQNYNRQTKECETILDWRNAATNKCVPFGRSTFVGLSNSSKYLYNTGRNKRTVEYCEKIPQPYETSTYSQSGLPTSMVDMKNDLRSSENILSEWKEIHCKMVNLSKKLRSKLFQDAALEKVRNYLVCNLLFCGYLIYLYFNR